jgi:phosphotransferase system enzyme I (PtsI)
MARALEIPAVVGLDTITSDISGGDTIIVDGNRGLVVISPDEQTIKKYQDLQKHFADFERALVREKDFPAVTADGKKINVYANIEFADEASSAISHGAEGIGLYRTEYLYVNSHEIPTEEDHFNAYKTAITHMNGRPLTIRTLDLGADKVFDPEIVAMERNPFLGCRSIRLSIARPDIFRTQIRAILRASVLGNTRIMLPMISTREEILWAKQQLEAVKEDLDKSKLPYDKQIKMGIMVETPSAALMASHLAKDVDFFSIGTNDLVQYTFAIDRTNEKVASLYEPAHPAMLLLLDTIIRAGKDNSIDVSLCGEMAGEPAYVCLLVGLGLENFSLSPSTIPEVKKIIRSVSQDDCRRLARKCLQVSDVAVILDMLRRQLKKVLPDAPF